MSSTPPQEIEVYASFPCTVPSVNGTELDFDPSSSKWHWVHCLTIPSNAIASLPGYLPQKPYKWIRYSIGVVIGAQGVLSTSEDASSFDPVDDNATISPGNVTSLFYHCDDEEKRRMFPLDLDVSTRHLRSVSDTVSTRTDLFKEEVAERDGRKCVLTGLGEVGCDAIHLLDRSKGNTYISNFTRRRSRDPHRKDVIDNIDDVRNGILLNLIAGTTLGKDLSFLVTPNFAMDTADVDPTASDPSERRCTSICFGPSSATSNSKSDLNSIVPSGARVRITGEDDNPPDILFEAVFAGAVLNHFGTQEFKDSLRTTWSSAFQPSRDAEIEISTEERAVREERAKDREKRLDEWRRRKAEKEQEPDGFDMLLTIPYIMVPPDELRDRMREAREREEEKEQRCLEERVNEWNRGVMDGE